jgi:hypothetical protein
MGSRYERRFGHADHRNVELGVRVRVRAQSWASGWIKVGKAVDNEQVQPGDAAQHRTERRQFMPVELTRLVGHHLRHDHGVLGHHGRLLGPFSPR